MTGFSNNNNNNNNNNDDDDDNDNDNHNHNHNHNNNNNNNNNNRFVLTKTLEIFSDEIWEKQLTRGCGGDPSEEQHMDFSVGWAYGLKCWIWMAWPVGVE